MSSRPASKTSPASTIFRIGLTIMVAAVALVALMARFSGEGSIFTGFALILAAIFVIPLGAIILLTSGIAGSAELIRARSAKKNASPLEAAAEVDLDAEPTP